MLTVNELFAGIGSQRATREVRRIKKEFVDGFYEKLASNMQITLFQKQLEFEQEKRKEKYAKR